MATGEPGTVYLLCFATAIGDPSRPRMSAKHYVGWFKDPARIAHHEKGTSGVTIVYAFFKRGIPFVVARTMPGSKTDERRIKAAGNHERNCPNCSKTPRNGSWKPL